MGSSMEKGRYISSTLSAKSIVLIVASSCELVIGLRICGGRAKYIHSEILGSSVASTFPRGVVGGERSMEVRSYSLRNLRNAS